MDFSLNENQLAFQDAARNFATGDMAPFAAQWDEQKIFPKDMLKKAGELGFMGMYCPESVGGMNLSRLDTTIILEELAMGCTSSAAFVSIHNMASWMIASWGTESIKQQWCADLIAGEKPTIKKINTAKEGNIKVINQAEWLKMLNKSG